MAVLFEDIPKSFKNLQKQDSFLILEKNFSKRFSNVFGDRYVASTEEDKVMWMDSYQPPGKVASQILQNSDIRHTDAVESIENLNPKETAENAYFVVVNKYYTKKEINERTKNYKVCPQAKKLKRIIHRVYSKDYARGLQTSY